MNRPGSLTITTPGEREILWTRVLSAPRHLVFEALSRPELLKRWLSGPPGWSMVDCENDLRVGGSFRHVWRGPEGMQMVMSGIYREVVPPERIVRTESMELGCESQAGEQLATMELTEEGGRTTLTITVLYPTKEARDATIASGMERGVAASYDRLADLLASGTPA
jgi:uncharacterized protein YndB with AHSA1/START domain